MKENIQVEVKTLNMNSVLMLQGSIKASTQSPKDLFKTQ